MARTSEYVPRPREPRESDVVGAEVEERDFSDALFSSPETTMFDAPPERTESPTIETGTGIEFRGTQFSEIKPNLMFAAEVDDGILLCFEIIEKSEIYEIWKRKISESNDFKRIANVATYALEQFAQTNYSDYLQDIYETGQEVFSPTELTKTKYSKLLTDIGIDDLKNIGVFLDKNIERNEVYEYKVRSISTPTAEDWSITALTLKTRFFLPSEIIASLQEDDDVSPLDEISTRIFGTPEYGWVIGTLNPHIDFFAPDDVIIAAMRTAGFIDVPVGIQEFIREIQKGISSHGICLVIEKIAKELGKIDEDTLKLLLSLLEGTRTIDEDVLTGIRGEVSSAVIPPDTSVHLMESEKKQSSLPKEFLPRGIDIPKKGKDPVVKPMKASAMLGDKSREVVKTKIKVDVGGTKGIAAAFNVIRSSKIAKGFSGLPKKQAEVRATVPVFSSDKTGLSSVIKTKKISKKISSIKRGKFR